MAEQRFKQMPEMYKGKPVEKLTPKEREKMFDELGWNKPEMKSSRAVPKGFNEEPDMGSAKKKMAKGGAAMKGPAKVAVVMGEFKAGKLKSGGTKKKVTKPKQAIAIALSEAGMAKKKKAKK